jgi:hypothetical protein
MLADQHLRIVMAAVALLTYPAVAAGRKSVMAETLQVAARQYPVRNSPACE